MALVLILVGILVVVAVKLWLDAQKKEGTRGQSARELQEDIEATLRWRKTRRYALLEWLKRFRL